jgi:DNA-directed RNA polymerase sigma subunit (sigma70/sigma32)
MRRDTNLIIEDLELILNVDSSCLKALTSRQLVYLYHRTIHPEIHYMTLQELADEFGCSRQAVDQLWRRALKRLGSLKEIQEKRRKNR